MGIGNKELFIVAGLACTLRMCFSQCNPGFNWNGISCVDNDECTELPDPCGKNANCANTYGSFFCWCRPGYRNIKDKINFTMIDGQCQDRNECLEIKAICGPLAHCSNRMGSYKCTCHSGYTENSSRPGDCRDVNECEVAELNREEICGEKGRCMNEAGSYWCKCPKGYTNYGNMKTPCSVLDCGGFGAESAPPPSLGGLGAILSMMRNSCLSLSNPNATSEESADGEALLEKLFTATVGILSPGHPESGEGVGQLLSAVESSILFIGPQLKMNRTRIDTTETDAEIAVRRGRARPTGPVHLSNENATLDTDWETASGNGTYPGFALAALLSYKSLTSSVNRSFHELRGLERDGVDPSFQVSSRVVSVVVSNPSTEHLSRSVNITLKHLEDADESPEVSYVCAYWSERQAWSTDGCYQQHSNASHTVCTCEHLSSFAVLMALYPIEHTFGLRLVTKVGLSLSIVCLILSILTFHFCRSIHGTRTTIHLHLCICLFLADLIFLAGITQTDPAAGCSVVAALLHYFFLGVFAWMLLEGVQLYRMVVLVFNATIRPLYLFLAGYGTPLLIVIVSAIVRPQGYGSQRHCWLSLQDNLIWSFFGPVCVIIVINVFFFLITVWRLAQKFTSLNPELSKLHKIRAFTVTAIAQMCILGLMWVFGALLYQKSATAVVAAYIFTILNGLQGALLFIMHCLLSKQVRDEYAHFFSCICTRQKKSYSDLSTTNPSSSQSQGSGSGQHTGESQI